MGSNQICKRNFKNRRCFFQTRINFEPRVIYPLWSCIVFNFPLSTCLNWTFLTGTIENHCQIHCMYISFRIRHWLVSLKSRRCSNGFGPPKKLTPHYQQQLEQGTSHFPALPSNVFIHSGDPGSARRSSNDDHRQCGCSSQLPFSVIATWRTVSRDASRAGKCHRAHSTLTPWFLFPRTVGYVTVRNLKKSVHKNTPRHWGARARSDVVATHTPRGRDSSWLATDEGCCTKSLRQPRARAQNPYSPALLAP